MNQRKLFAAAVIATLGLVGLTDRVDASPATPAKAASQAAKLDGKLAARAARGPAGKSRTIVVLKPGCDATADYEKAGGRRGRRLGIINADVVEVPNGQLAKLAASRCVKEIHWDRPTKGENNRTAVTVGARAVQYQMGFNGAGVGVAVIDSGITPWHDDLTYFGWNNAVQTVNGQRLVQFVDFVNGQTLPYDDNGHGSHVAGIILGNGLDSFGARAGIAPAANLVSLKVLDHNGGGVISNVIAALDWVVANRVTHRIKVVNLSVGAGVYQSYWTDPLTLAAKRVVDAGVVVVTAAGNLGRHANGREQFGAITAPGNAPWVLTVGASSHQGTSARPDDVLTGYSSRGPTAFDYTAKPDVVAPGTGSVSLAVAGSTLYNAYPQSLLNGSWWMPDKPYLSLTGTSMSAPVVAGTVALMMQANPSLTPNLAKAIIQYTAQNYGYHALKQGAGFLNAQGAVTLAQYLYTAQPGSAYPSDAAWSKSIIWGTHRLKNGVITANGSAYGLNVVWGAARDGEGDDVVWGTTCPATDPECDNVVWGSSENCDPALDPECDNIVWGTSGECDPALDPECDNIVWGTTCAEGDPECDNVVWGSECGGADCDNIVWGTTCDPQLDPECDNIVWGTTCNPQLDPECDNIVWGTTCDPALDPECDNIVWGTAIALDVPLYDDPDALVAIDELAYELLFGVPPSFDLVLATMQTSIGIDGLSSLTWFKTILVPETTTEPTATSSTDTSTAATSTTMTAGGGF